MPDDTSRASVRIARRIEWIDTDAAGIYHWTTVFRLAELAETELHRGLGIAERTFGLMPRLAVTTEYLGPLRFDDRIEVELGVQEIGRTSLRYAWAIHGPEGEAARGTMTVCLVDGGTWRPTPWPQDIRDRLSTSGMIRAT
jgi:acyl-CoA thioesterase FadM